MDWRQLIRLLGFCTSVLCTVLFFVGSFAFYHNLPESAVFIKFFASYCLLALGLINYGAPLSEKTWHIPVALKFVMFSWLSTVFFAALPLYLGLQLSFVDAMFVSISGLTTTGAEVLDLSQLSPAWLLYRQMLQLVGGLGIILVATAFIPGLRQMAQPLYRIDFGGADKQSKWLPRWSDLVSWMMGCYLAIWLACSLSFHWCGLDWFSALCESMSTVSTGGFSTHNQSLGFYQSPGLLWVANLFMLLSAIGYATHYTACSGAKLTAYFKNQETRWLCAIIMLVILYLLVAQAHNRSLSLCDIAFNTISMITTTGHRSVSTDVWPAIMPWLLQCFALLGGCSGSTSGGLKMWRMRTLMKDIRDATGLMLHPQAVFSDQDWRSVDNHLACRLSRGFFVLFILVLFLGVWWLTLSGLDGPSAISASFAALSNVGVGVAGVAQGYGHLSDAAKWIFMLLMLAGRLEILPILIVFQMFRPFRLRTQRWS